MILIGMYIFPDSLIILTTIDLAIKSNLFEYIRNVYMCESFRRVVINELHDILVSYEFQNYMQSV